MSESEEVGPQEPAITLEQIAKVRALERAWNGLKSDLRDDLVTYFFEQLAYTARNRETLTELSHRVRIGLYRPKAMTIVRSAKRDGLSRPLAFLDLDDQVLLKAIVDKLSARLHAGMPDYVNYSARRTPRAGDKGGDGYETWIETWLRHQELYQRFLGETSLPFVVEADVASFFPSINNELLRDGVHRSAHADTRVVDLLFLILSAIALASDYSAHHNSGLPQENHDASRALAHYFLRPVDDLFAPQGAEGRYVRWMDDIKIGATSLSEGRHFLAKLEIRLESLDLRLNSSKSKVTPSGRAKKELLLEENGFLEECEAFLLQGTPKPLRDVESFIADFLDKLEGERPPQGDRVLRRCYTISRHYGSAFLERHVAEHLRSYPGSADYVVKYLLSRPHNVDLLQIVQDYLSSEDNLYEDVEIRLYRLLCRWRAPFNESNRHLLVEPCIDRFFQNGKTLHSYSRGLITGIVFKYGSREQFERIARHFDGSFERELVRLATPFVFAAADFRDMSVRKALSTDDLTLKRTVELCERIGRTEQGQLERWLTKALTPPTTRRPKLFVVDPELLALLQISRSSPWHRSTEWSDKVDTTVVLLSSEEVRPLVVDEFAVARLRRLREDI